MPGEQHTDPATPIPDAGPLRDGPPAEPDQPEPAEVLGMADADESEQLARNDADQ